ncbi:MAG TPA: hypothetical protein VJ732_16510 [Bryobacteraceae bacterium]|nr:hypothetical protein [Bryobacteraceae bacterium]
MAVPTVVRHSPLPERRVIGTLSNTAGAAAALGLPDEKQWAWQSWWK